MAWQATLSALIRTGRTSRGCGRGMTAKDLAEHLRVPLSTIYTELRRGRTGDRLPDQRLEYDAELAQLRVQESLERRGRRAAGA